MQRARNFNVYHIFSNTRVGMHCTGCTFMSPLRCNTEHISDPDLYCVPVYRHGTYHMYRDSSFAYSGKVTEVFFLV